MSVILPVAEWPEKTTAIVVFIHGLTGDPYLTWQSGSDESSFWPAWLCQDVRGLAGFVAAYDAPASNWAGTSMALEDRAANLKENLLTTFGDSSVPIILICHSLGGLLAKQIIITLHSEKEWRPDSARFLARIKAAVFLATPHTGARKATLLKHLALLTWPSAATLSLTSNHPALRAINVSYRGLAQQYSKSLTNIVFYETQHTTAGVIVDEGAADPGLPGAPPIPIDANHITIAKPRTRQALAYAKIRSSLTSFADASVAEPFHLHPRQKVQLERASMFVPRLLRVALIVFVAGLFLAAWKGLMHDPIQAARHEQRAELERLYREKLNAQKHYAIAGVAAAEGVPPEFLREVAINASDALPFEDLAKLLSQRATQFKFRKEEPSLRQFNAQAARLADQGRTVEAAMLLAERRQARSQQGSANKDANARWASQSLVEEAKLTALLGKFAEAGHLFGEALKLLPDNDPLRPIYLSEHAEVLSEASKDSDNPIDLLTSSVRISTEAMAQLARVETRTAMLRIRSVAVGTQAMLAVEEQDQAKLVQATTSLGDVLKDFTDADGRGRLITLQNIAGRAYQTLGQLRNDQANLQQALGWYRKAKDGAKDALDRVSAAVILNNLATTLSDLNHFEFNIERTDEAINLSRQALEYTPRDLFPSEWAKMKLSIGYGLYVKGVRLKNADDLQAAVVETSAAIGALDRQQHLHDWAGMQYQLGETALAAAQQASDAARSGELLTAAIRGFEATIESSTQPESHQIRIFQKLRQAYYMRGNLKTSADDFDRAAHAAGQWLSLATQLKQAVSSHELLGMQKGALLRSALVRSSPADAERLLTETETLQNEYMSMHNGARSPNLDALINFGRVEIAKYRERNKGTQSP